MKKKLIFILISILIIMLMMLNLQGGKKILGNLNQNHISYISINSFSPNKDVLITEKDEINNIITTLEQLTMYKYKNKNKASSNLESYAIILTQDDGSILKITTSLPECTISINDSKYSLKDKDVDLLDKIIKNAIH